MSRRSRTAALVLVGALLLGAPALSGCSLINNFLPGGGNGGGLPGGVIPGQSIPDDFPKNEVPLIDGDVLLALSVPADNGDKAWNVTIKVAGGEAWDTIKGQFSDAGYEYQELSVSEDGSSGAFTKDPYSVLVVVSHDQDNWTANYTVTNADTGE